MTSPYDRKSITGQDYGPDIETPDSFATAYDQDADKAQEAVTHFDSLADLADVVLSIARRLPPPESRTTPRGVYHVYPAGKQITLTADEYSGLYRAASELRRCLERAFSE